MKLLTTSFVFKKLHMLGNKNAVYNKLRSFIFWHFFLQYEKSYIILSDVGGFYVRLSQRWKN
jgi:hypothetical protein